ncbi:MAG TPA: hypothetical protein VGN18_00715 [Jatrophihabitans sp.]|uniref:hypothetical protein n=1 Tax=Jatrophihabitans sp. TaxID=1932789 RepID=UPI002DF9059F|nr:hypothetical protein [Jatrophihabitans sp.]
MVDEVAAVPRLSGRTASDRVATAPDLVRRYPAPLDAPARGELTLDHVRVLSDEALGLDDATAALVEARVLELAGGKTRARGRLVGPPHARRRHPLDQPHRPTLRQVA